MIAGVVTSHHEAVVRLSVYRASDAVIEVEAIVDTGYNGELTLPPSAIAALELTWRRRSNAILADGSSVEFDVYAARIEWDGTLRPVVVDASDCEPLIGMRLLDGYELTIQAVPGGTVTITALGSG